MKVAIPLAKKILAPWGITAADSAIVAGIQKKILGSGTTTLIISKEKKWMTYLKIINLLKILIFY